MIYYQVTRAEGHNEKARQILASGDAKVDGLRMPISEHNKSKKVASKD